MRNQEALPVLLDIPQLAERLGTSVRHVRALVAGHQIPYLKVGHYVRFDPDDIREWLNNCRASD